jgi:hypothetical protein
VDGPGREERQGSVFTEEEEDVLLDEEEADYELRDLRKGAMLDDLVCLYASPLDIDMWYNIRVDEGIAQV